MNTKAKTLHDLISQKGLSFLMEAHNGLSAKIVQEAGFSGIWASGLSMSAALGVRDNNEASWTQVLEVVEFMADATTIPILLDGDTGYGNFNNMRRLVRKLEQRQVAGVCIEDKIFPKTNSFINGVKQELASIDEFCGKIKAAKDTQRDENFVVVARVEALIAGWGMSEAIKRAEQYRLAGADAVLIHSKRPDASEVLEFMDEWGDRLPVVIVPTKYFSTPTHVFKDNGVSTIIWANHNCRAAITAMQAASENIYRNQSLMGVEGEIASVAEVFRLQGEEELRAAESSYLPGAGKTTNAVILAASGGIDLYASESELPKIMLNVSGKSILARHVNVLNSINIKKIAVVCGYGAHHVVGEGFEKILNENYHNSSDLYSLYCALDYLTGETVISFGDIVYKPYVLHALMAESHDVTLIVDSNYRASGDALDYVKASLPASEETWNHTPELNKIFTVDAKANDPIHDVDGEFIGLWKISANANEAVKLMLEDWQNRGILNERSLVDFINEISTQLTVGIRYISGSWLDIDDLSDLQKDMNIC